MDDPVIRDAIKLHDRILAAGREFEIRKRCARSQAESELAEADFYACQDAAAMLKKLGTEVTRLRLAIQHFDYGRMSRLELRQITANWNGDK